MAFTSGDLDKINAAIAGGIKKVVFSDGRTTEYQTTADMLKARDAIKADIAAPSVGSRLRTTVGRVRKGCR